MKAGQKVRLTLVNSSTKYREPAYDKIEGNLLFDLREGQKVVMERTDEHAYYRPHISTSVLKGIEYGPNNEVTLITQNSVYTLEVLQ